MYNIHVDITKKMFEIATSNDKHKAYEICMNCPFMGDTCDGPNVAAMDYSQWAEWASAFAKRQELTHSTIAEVANLPKGTVDSALSGKNKDIRADTKRMITQAIVGGCWGKYPCHMAALLIDGVLDEENFRADTLEKELKRAKEDLAGAKENASRNVDLLKEEIEFRNRRILSYADAIRRKDRIILWLGVMLAVLAFATIGLLFYDVVRPTIGLFQH